MANNTYEVENSILFPYAKYGIWGEEHTQECVLNREMMRRMGEFLKLTFEGVNTLTNIVMTITQTLRYGDKGIDALYMEVQSRAQELLQERGKEEERVI